MEQYLYTSGIITLLLLTLSFPAIAQNNNGAPDQNNMIKQRLRSDIEDLKNENETLKERIEQFESQQKQSASNSVLDQGELRKENQRLRKLLQRYRKAIHQLVETMRQADSALKQSETTTNTGEEVTHETQEKQDPEVDEKWIQDENRPYPIRREPLQKEITYTTGPNDTLSKLAHQYYHDAELWIRIYLVNEDRLDSPDNLPPGTKLRLPPIDRIRK